MNKQEATRITTILREYPETKFKADQGTAYLAILNFQSETIEEEISSGKLKGLPLARLLVEYAEGKWAYYNKKVVHDLYIQRVEEYKPKHEALIKECEENYDRMLELAKKAAVKNKRLELLMNMVGDVENDMQAKVEFYNYLKAEVESDGVVSDRFKVIK